MKLNTEQKNLIRHGIEAVVLPYFPVKVIGKQFADNLARQIIEDIDNEREINPISDY